MNNKISWRNYLIEIVVVFIGITAAFLLNTWREGIKDSELEETYLAGITRDLENDSELLDSLLIATETKLTRVENSIRNFSNSKINEEKIITIIMDIMSMQLFENTSGAYQSLKNSGALGLIKNKLLLGEISDYYESLNGIRHKEDIYQKYIYDYGTPFAYKSMDILTSKIRLKSFDNSEFGNIMAGYYVLLKQNNGAYKTQKEKLELLLSKLSEH